MSICSWSYTFLSLWCEIPEEKESLQASRSSKEQLLPKGKPAKVTPIQAVTSKSGHSPTAPEPGRQKQWQYLKPYKTQEVDAAHPTNNY